MDFFERYKSFIDDDNRKDRPYHPTTAESMSARHETIAPKWLVEGATILDLGSCIGATGHWCLANGAKHYTGVEIQDFYVQKSNQLLAEHWPADQFKIEQTELEHFVKHCDKKFDVVFVCGIIYGFLNTYEILKAITDLANQCIVIDTSYPTKLFAIDQSVIEITTQQHMIQSDSDKTYTGLGSRPSPAALSLIMNNLGYESKEKILFPRQLTNIQDHDSYHSPLVRKHGIPTPAKYIMRFFKSAEVHKSAVQSLISNDTNYIKDFPTKPLSYDKVAPWEFDDQVAARFQTEARTHIPDYERVITYCLDTVSVLYPNKNIRIAEVGSALGYTVDRFVSRGYNNITGIEISTSMKDRSLHQDKIVVSSSLPADRYDVVLANWTLHFILERKEYIKDIFNSLNTDGIFILSDKMTQSISSKELYYTWKRSNGVTQEEINVKERKLRGVMETKSLDWYVEVLAAVGFKDIECVNSRFNFNTLLCRK